MFRKFIAVTLFVTFVAMSTSGLMMIFINQTSFAIQMHPVHKIFGLIMVFAAACHITLNSKGLLNHLKTKAVSIFGGVLVTVLVLLYGAAINRSVPPELAKELNTLSEEAERQAEGGE